MQGMLNIVRARMPAQIRHARLVETARRRGFLLVTDIAAELGKKR